MTKLLDEYSKMIYTVDHEAVSKDENSDPSEKGTNRRNVRRHENFMQVGIQFFVSLFVDTMTTTKSLNEINLQCAAVVASVIK